MWNRFSDRVRRVHSSLIGEQKKNRNVKASTGFEEEEDRTLTTTSSDTENMPNGT